MRLREIKGRTLGVPVCGVGRELESWETWGRGKSAPAEAVEGQSGAGRMKPNLGGPCPVHQQRRGAPGGDSREGARWVCPWCGGATGKAPVGRGPQAVRIVASPWFHDFHCMSGPRLCGSPNSPQIWLRPPALTPMTGRQVLKEGLFAGRPGSASPWASWPPSGRVAVGPQNASGVSTGRQCHHRARPFLCPSLLEGRGQARRGPGFLWLSCYLREVPSQKTVAAVTLVTSLWRLVGPGGRELSAQLALGAGARAGMPPSSGGFQGRRMDCAWKSASLPLGTAPEAAAAPCPQSLCQSRGRGGLPWQSSGSDATLPMRDSQVELVVKNPLAKAGDPRDGFDP